MINIDQNEIISIFKTGIAILIPMITWYFKNKFERLGYSAKKFETIAPHLNDRNLFSKSELFLEEFFLVYLNCWFPASHIRFILSRRDATRHFHHAIRARQCLQFDSGTESYRWAKGVPLKYHKLLAGMIWLIAGALYLLAGVLWIFYSNNILALFCALAAIVFWFIGWVFFAPLWSAEHLQKHSMHYPIYPKEQQFYESIDSKF